MSDHLPSRRVVFQGLSALGVAAVLAGCGGEAARPRAEPDGSSSPDEPGETAPDQLNGPKEKTVEALATTDEIPVGGGVVLTAERIVITQPSRGRFEAFSAVCKHQGQTVGKVADNTITCTFHGSQYSAADGSVTNGPATSGLDPVEIRIQQGRIVRA